MTTGRIVGGAAAPYRLKNTGRQARFLAQSVVLEEAGASRLLRLAILVSCGIVLAFIAWASFTELEEVTSTFGQVVPAGNIRQVQHLEGGIVQEILVEEGEMVDAGQVLVRFSPAQARAELEAMRAREVSLSLRAERLRAVGAGRAPDFSFVPEQYKGLIEDQKTIYAMQMQAHETGRAVLQRQLQQRREELALIHDQQEALRRQIALVSEEVAMREELVEKGLVSRIVYIDTQREYTRLQGELNGLLSQERAALQRIGEIEERLADAETELRQAALNEMGEVTAELAQVRQALTDLEDRVSRLEVRAPVHGLVQNLAVHTVGAVVPSGGLITEIVPLEEDLEVEVRINTRDIGQVQVGQPVSVKITTYDFSRYGSVEGELIRVSPTTFLDEEDRPYYKGRVRLAQAQVGSPERPILPGMTVEANVVTGQKTLLQYLLKPFYIALSDAFRER